MKSCHQCVLHLLVSAPSSMLPKLLGGVHASAVCNDSAAVLRTCLAWYSVPYMILPCHFFRVRYRSGLGNKAVTGEHPKSIQRF